MKIVLIGAHFPPEFTGGSEMVLEAHARELVKLGCEVRVISGTSEPWDGREVRRETRDELEILRLARTPEECSSLDWNRPRIAALVERETRDADLVHVHHWLGLSGDLVRKLCATRPVVLTLHDHFASCPRFFRIPREGSTCPSGGETAECAHCLAPEVDGMEVAERKVLLAQRLSNFLAEIAAASLVITPSEYLREAVTLELGVDGKGWRVLPHGLCRELSFCLKEGVEEDPLTVLHFGNRAEIKGTLDLVQAAAALPKGRIRLILVGAEVECGFDARLRAAAGELDLEIHDSYDTTELRRQARRSDLAAFPTKAQESYGLVVEEALAVGLPVWVSDRGAFPEVLRAAARYGPLPGAILPADDPPAWEAALRELVEDRERLQDARAALPARPRTSAATARTLLELYTELLEEAPLTGP